MNSLPYVQTLAQRNRYTNLTVVRRCESGRSPDAISTRANKFSFFSSLNLDITQGSPVTQIVMVVAENKRTAGQN